MHVNSLYLCSQKLVTKVRLELQEQGCFFFKPRNETGRKQSWKENTFSLHSCCLVRGDHCPLQCNLVLLAGEKMTWQQGTQSSQEWDRINIPSSPLKPGITHSLFCYAALLPILTNLPLNADSFLFFKEIMYKVSIIVSASKENKCHRVFPKFPRDFPPSFLLHFITGQISHFTAVNLCVGQTPLTTLVNSQDPRSLCINPEMILAFQGLWPLITLS